MPQELIWRVSAGVFFTVHAYAVGNAWLQLAHLRRGGMLQHARVAYYTYPAGGASILVLILAVLSPFDPTILSGLYVCALLIVLSPDCE